MRWFILAVASLALVVLLPADRGVAYPKPEQAEQGRWVVSMQFRPMRMISITDRVTGKKVLYWYLLYTVANDTGQDNVQFNPDFTLLTDTNKLYRDVLDMTAFQAIKARHSNMMLLNPIEVSGPLRAGQGFAKDGVAIFKEIDRDTDAFKVFVSGISDDSRSVVNPITGVKTNLYRTLERSYRQPGDKEEINQDKIFFVGQRYIYR
jgi:hypothetical protein